MTLSHTFRDKGNGDCAVCSEDWDHPYHTGSNPDGLAKAADALLKAIEVWEACYLDSVWRDQVQPARQKLAEVIDATPPAPVQPTASVEAVDEIMTGICDCERSHNGLGISGRECDCGPTNDGWQAEAEAQASALCERAGIDVDDWDQFKADLEQTLIDFATWTASR